MSSSSEKDVITLAWEKWREDLSAAGVPTIDFSDLEDSKVIYASETAVEVLEEIVNAPRQQ